MSSLTIRQTLGALAFVAALATSTTALAATPTSSLKSQNLTGTTGPAHIPEVDELELNLTCPGGWLLMYDEDKNGNPVPGSGKIAECKGSKDKR